MNLFENNEYNYELEEIIKLNLPFEQFKNKTFLITGGTGLIGSSFIEVLLKLNKKGYNCKIYCICRNIDFAKKRFLPDNNLIFIKHDISKELNIDDHFDYILHLASNTQPKKYAEEPVETILTNILGLQNVLNLADINTRVLFTSSCEIYGENRNDIDSFTEDYCGYINCNTLRAGYTEGKRCSEALCQAYIKQFNKDIVIARLARVYGPSILKNDTRAINQFLNKALNNEDVILKSEGKQEYSFLYSMDAVSGLFTILLKGKTGEAYNVSDEKSDITLKELAYLIAKEKNVKVKFELPSELEKSGYSVVMKSKLDNSKLKSLGWSANYNIKTGIKNTISILK
jgi:nucleoside-diphosphate-sugar epimerase